jgi:ribonuclease P protein subunit POP4
MATPKPHIAQELLSRAHSPDTAEQLFTERIKQKPLFLRPTSPTPADNRSRRRLQRIRKKEYFYRKQKPQPLSARQKRVSGIYDIAKEECKYEIFKGLHDMWVQYMHEVLGIDEQQNTNKPMPHITPYSHGSKLVTADYHGAEVEVVRSRCAGRVGSKGIVVRDNKFTFVIVTEKDVVKSTFRLTFFCLEA